MIGLIYRAPEYSPRDNVAKDAAILDAVGQALKESGQPVCFVHEEDWQPSALVQCSACISMARRFRSLLSLQKLQQHGVMVLNAPNAVQVTVQSRSTTLEMLQAEGLPVADFWSYEPSEDASFLCDEPLQELLPGWVKAMHPRGVREGDVQMVNSALEADSRVLQLAAEGYTDIIVTRHVEGPLLKLYVVDGRIVNDSSENDCYGSLVERITQTLHLDIFGVDLIVSRSGVRIIDVNDFPSFNSCRAEAARAIADMVIARSWGGK
ncbi:MAG: hypothetical protein K6E86_09820 [Bacteroidales bacterium]|nr:hypothetical protein [Bacteroidales bacterium]